MKAFLINILMLSAFAFDLSWLDFDPELNFRHVLLGFKGVMHGIQQGIYNDPYF